MEFCLDGCYEPIEQVNVAGTTKVSMRSTKRAPSSLFTPWLTFRQSTAIQMLRSTLLLVGTALSRWTHRSTACPAVTADPGGIPGLLVVPGPSGMASNHFWISPWTCFINESAPPRRPRPVPTDSTSGRSSPWRTSACSPRSHVVPALQHVRRSFPKRPKPTSSPCITDACFTSVQAISTVSVAASLTTP